jgi:cytochrome P450
MLLRFYWPRFVAACERRYGKTFTLKVTSLGPVVFLADPHDIKEVFAGDDFSYRAGEANAVLRGLLGDNSLLVLDGDPHREWRRLLLIALGREAVARHTDMIIEVTADNMSRWPQARPFPVARRLQQITLEVILRSVIGATDPTRLTELREVIPRILNMSPFATLAVAYPDLRRRLPWRSINRDFELLDRILLAEIADRQADPDLDARTDALAILVSTAPANIHGQSVTAAEFRDQLMTLLFAGHDTTAAALSWTLERLVRNPTALKEARCAAHASATGDPAGDDYLDALLKESLRIRPVVFNVGRVIHRPVELAGYSLPAGITVAPAIGLVHACPESYPEPTRFEPERFLADRVSPSTWMPFGGGSRRCPGAAFAMFEMRIVLRELLCRVDFNLTDDDGERQRVKHVTLVPHRGARISVGQSNPNDLPTDDPSCPSPPDPS